MRHSVKIKIKAKRLRKSGHSIKEISSKLQIAQSTSSLWVRDIKLDQNAIKRLRKRKIYGQYKSSQVRLKKRARRIKKINSSTYELLKKIDFNKSHLKLLLSFLFWTEGGKSTDSYVYFINSEPKMVRTFLKLMRYSFDLDENKFRALLHLHNYHSEKEIKKFWSNLTGIPPSQFTKSYSKPNTKKRIRKDYKGSIRIRYYDYKIALELRSYYNTFVSEILGV